MAVTDIDGPTFVELMEKYGIKPSQLGITPTYKLKLKKGERKPSKELILKLFSLIRQVEGRNKFMEVTGMHMYFEGLVDVMDVLREVEEYSRKYIDAIVRVHEKVCEIDSRLSRLLLVVHDVGVKDVVIERKSTNGREVLEGVVANVLRDLGFEVFTNIVIPSIVGGGLELDVLGRRILGDTTFYVYATCKNFARPIDRNVVAHELGRLLLMSFKPHLVLFVVSNIERNAKIIASRIGFVVIEVGFKVTNENVGLAYSIVRKRLEELFKGYSKD